MADAKDAASSETIPPPLSSPEQISSIMAPAHELASDEHNTFRATSQTSQLSNDSIASDFLDTKIAEMETKLEYIRCVRDKFIEAKEADVISQDTFQRELAPHLASFRSSSHVIRALQRQRQLIIEDLDEEVASRRQMIDGPTDQRLLECAYKDAIIARVLGANARQKSTKFDHTAFKKAVNAYYGINEHCLPGFSYCHVLGTILPTESVKTAYIVPQYMTREEVSHLFGVEDAVLTDPRNGKNIHLD